MDALIVLIPGVVAALGVWLLARGVALFRADPLGAVPAEVLLEGRVLAEATKTESSVIQRLGRRFTPTLRAALPDSLLRRLQRQIDAAGRPQGVDVDSVLATYAGLILITSPVLVLSVASRNFLLALLLLLYVGIFPIVRLVSAARKRRERIDRDLPDFLDILAVTVSAGVGFRSALSTVAARFGGPLSEELTTTLHQISNGASVRSAFSSLRRRTNSTSLDQFVTAYLQAEELGAPLIDALNQIADDMRHASAQKALQRANAVSPRISLVSTLVLVPACVILMIVGLIVGSGVDLSAVLGG